MAILHLHRGIDDPVGLALLRQRHSHKRPFPEICVLVFVYVHRPIRPEVDWIGTTGPRAIDLVRIKHLGRERFPSSRRSSVYSPRPTLAEPVEFLFDHG